MQTQQNIQFNQNTDSTNVAKQAQTTQVATQTQSNVAAGSSNKSPKKPKNKKPVIFAAAIIGVLVLVGAGIVALNQMDGDDKKEKEKEDETPAAIEIDRGQDSGAELLPEFPEEERPIALEEAPQLPADFETTPLDEEVATGRRDFTSFVSNTQNSTVDLVDITEKSEPLTVEEVQQVKQEFAEVSSTLDSEPGDRIELTIDYSSIGDEDFEEGTLFVKLSQGLTLVEGSITNEFNGETVQVSDSVYRAEDNLITYGPGTTDATSSRIGVGESGTLTLVVEIAEDGAQDLMVSSYLKDKDGKTGKPGIIFLEN